MYIVMMIKKTQKNPTKIKMKQFILLMKTWYTRYKPDPISWEVRYQTVLIKIFQWRNGKTAYGANVQSDRNKK